MTLGALALFAITLFVAAGSPGPSVAALVARVLSRGHRDVLPFLAAMWLGEALWLTLAVFGLAAVATSFHGVFVAIKWAGVAYLFWLAWKMWFARTETAGAELPQASSGWKMFLTGISITIGNPKIMMFYVALLPTILDLASVTLVGWLELTVTLLLVLAVVDLAWVFLATRARRLLKSPRAMKIANRLSAGMIGGAAVAIATR
ncbi:LysE family translocator [Martelella mediterranea]|uniref:Homoserine/homoserine lactone efflux protein n=1 Tax=Martelella mediterranea DSM 17316 TaxID=1122214 RepID=A0A1U9YZM3_9HYPH|nr:LysE family translocator [Martelella mediterranea]AQZ50840.1 Homoserine/homoserine lactone efflux protein [Martelella mediterranea DSM 17316]